MDSSSVCRACLLEIHELDYRVSLFDNGYNSYFETCTSIQVLRDDVYPKVLCSLCSRFLDQLKEFQEKCKQSKFRWDSYLNSLRDEGPTGATAEVADMKEEIKSKLSHKDGYEALEYYSSIDELDVEEESEILPTICNTNKNHGNSEESENFESKSNISMTEFEGESKLTLTEFDQSIMPISHLSSCNKILEETTESHTGKLGYKIVLPSGDKRRSTFFETCQYCGKSYCYEKTWIKHVSSCKMNMGQNLITEKETILHNLLMCGICSKQFDNLEQVKSHLMLHESSGNLLCELCDFSALDFADLLQHRYSHGTSVKKYKIICFKCNCTFKKLDRLEFHYRLVHLKKTPGVCKQCSKEFNNYSHYMTHLVKHTGERFTCNTCQKTFTYEKSMRKHQLVHGTRKFMCHLCGFRSRRPNGLQNHINRRHIEHDPIPCPDCGKVFKSKDTLYDHRLREHTEKSYVCPVCSKKYKRKAQMILHQKWHSDEKPFTCDICGRGYKAKAHLLGHMRIHTGQRPFKCDVCGKAFIGSNALKKHKLTHSGVKAYRCDNCDKRYVTKKYLSVHMRKHNVRIDEHK